MKHIPKWLRIVLVLVLLSCVGTFIGSISIQGSGLAFKIGACVAAVGVWLSFIYFLGMASELSNFKKREEENYVFHFPRSTSQWSFMGSSLAELARDYHLRDDEIERIARAGVNKAATEYREKHPLDSQPSSELFDTVFPYE